MTKQYQIKALLYFIFQKQIKHSAKEKKNTLNEAFEVIKINVDGNEMVTYKTWSRLLRLAHPGKTKHQIDLLMMVLDTDSTGYISKWDFPVLLAHLSRRLIDELKV